MSRKKQYRKWLTKLDKSFACMTRVWNNSFPHHNNRGRTLDKARAAAQHHSIAAE